MVEYERSGDEFLGFVGTMKAHMSKEIKATMKSIQQLEKKMDQKMDE
jgi:hypothetical protein